MKKIVKRLALLLCTMAGLGLGFSSCAVHGTGVIDDTTGGGGKGSVAVETDAEIIAKYPNQFMYRYGGKADDQFSTTEPYSITDFGKPTDDLMKENSVFRYYPTPVDLAKGTGEFSAVINQGKDEGQQGVGFVQIQDGKVVGWWLVTSHNKIRYWNPNNEVDTSKKSENGSGWDGGSLGAFVTNKDYTVKIKLVESLGKTSDNKGDGGERGFEVKVYDGENVVAEKYCKYGRWMTPNANSKIYFAIGAVKNDSKNNTWKNVTVKIGNGETYTMKKVVNVQDQSSMTVLDSEGKAVSSILLSAGKSVTYSYSAKDKEGSAVVPTVVSDNPAIVSVEKNDTAKTITVTAGTTEGTANVTVTNESGTGKPSVKIKVEVAVPGTITLDGVAKTDDLLTVFNTIASDNSDHTIKLGKGTYTIPTGSKLEYTGTGTLTIEGDTTTEYGADVKIKGNPNNNTESTRNLLYLKGNGNFILKNFKIENLYNLSSDCQAEALASNGTGHIAAYNCTFASHQDTIRTTGKAWFYKCYISGDVDFIWMEESGTVALYEDCVLHMVGDRTKSAYIAAPRATKQSTIGLGVVVLNSKIKIDEGVDAYLFRNPWYSSDATKLAEAKNKYYNQAAFVGTTVATDSAAQLNTALAKSESFGVGNNAVVGWKTDGVLTAANVGTISDTDKTGIYHNRGHILNKLIKITDGNTAYKSDTAIWDVSAAPLGWAESASATSNPAPEVFDESAATITWSFTDIAPTAEGTTLKGSANTFAGTIAGYTGNKTVNMDVRFGATAWGTPKMKPWDATNSRTESYNVIITVPVTAGATLTVPLTNSAAKVFLNGTAQASAGTALSWKNTGSELVNAVIWTTTEKAYLSTVKLEDYNLNTTVDTTPAATFVAIVGDNSVAANANTTLKGYVIGSYGYDSSSASITWAVTGANATIGTDGKLTGDGSATGTATVTATSGSLSATKEVTITQALSWDSAEWYITGKNGSTAGAGIGGAAENIAGSHSDAFIFANYSLIGLGKEESVTPLEGDETTTTCGLKMDGNGKFTFTVDRAATITVKAAYFEYLKNENTTKHSKLLKISSEDGTATADSNNPTTDVSADTTFVWTLTAGTYSITRNSGNTVAPYYVKVVKN